MEASVAARLHAEAAGAQAVGRLPSLVAAMSRAGSIEWCHGDPDAQYRIGSITKTFTAVLVLQLRDAGQLRLEDPASSYLPGVPFGDRTVRELLTHKGAIPAEPPGAWWERAPGVEFERLAGWLMAADAPHVPRGAFHYSNLGYALLGEIAARLGGAPWRTLVQLRILAPLRMGRTTYLPEAPHALGYSVHPYARTLHAEPATDTEAMAPAGQLWSTAADLATYADFLVKGDPEVLSASSVAEMASPRWGERGLGVHRLGGQRDLVGHTGSMPGFQAALFADPATGVAAIALANSTFGLDSTGIVERLFAAAAETGNDAPDVTAPTPWVPTARVPEGVAELLGVWHWGNTPYVVRWENEQLELTTMERFGLDGARSTDWFVPEATDTYRGVGEGYHRGESLHVVRRPDGQIGHLSVSTFRLTRTPYDEPVTLPGTF